MAKKITQLGVDVGNKQVKILGDNSDVAIYPAALVKYDTIESMVDDTKLKNYSLYQTDETNNAPFLWGENLAAFGANVQETKGTDFTRYDDPLFKNLVLAAVASYVKEQNAKDDATKVTDLAIETGMPTAHYLDPRNGGEKGESYAWLRGKHVLTIDGETLTFNVTDVEVRPQSYGTAALFAKTYELDFGETVAVLDFGGGTMVFDVYRVTEDGMALLRDFNIQENKGADVLIDNLVRAITAEGVTNPNRNNHSKIQDMLIKQNYVMRVGIGKERDFSDVFQREINRYVNNLLDNINHAGIEFNTLAALIITGGGANWVNAEAFENRVEMIYWFDQPETANVRGFYVDLIQD